LRFAAFISVVVLISSAVYPWVIKNIFDSFEVLLGNVTSDTKDLEVLQARRGELIQILLAYQLFFVGLVFGISIFLSHRIAGPIYKAKKFIRNLRAPGQFQSHLSFRKKDNFHDLADELSLLATNLSQENERIGAMIQPHPALIKSIDRLKRVQEKADKDTQEEVSQVIESMENVLYPKPEEQDASVRGQENQEKNGTDD
jgi:methyl-accepting chemotaxis protein